MTEAEFPMPGTCAGPRGAQANWPVTAGSCRTGACGRARPLQVIGRRSLTGLLAVARVERDAKQERGGLGSVRLEIDVGEGHIGFRVGPGSAYEAWKRSAATR